MKTNSFFSKKLLLFFCLAIFSTLVVKAQRPDTIVCVGTPYSYHFDYLGSDSAYFTYDIDGSTFSTSSDTIIPFNTSVGGYHTIVVTWVQFDFFGMPYLTSTTTYTIGIDNCGFGLGPDQIVCLDGPCFTLRDLSITPAVSYEWLINGVHYSSANDTTFCPSTVSSYEVICHAMGGGSVSSDTMWLNAVWCTPQLGNDTNLCIGSCLTLHTNILPSATTIFDGGDPSGGFLSGFTLRSDADSAVICSMAGSTGATTQFICTNYVVSGGLSYEYADTINITTISCDSVWPGDADYDGIANNYDVLALGIAYGSAGTSRSAADNLWYAHYAPIDFVGAFIDGINYKNADCNGDGTVDGLDTVAIINNYGFSHARGLSSIVDTISPDLYVVYNFDTIIESALATGDIYLGNGADISAYGLAFGLSIDTSVINISTFNIDFTGSWLASGDMPLNLVKRLATQIDIAQTGTNHTNKIGHGVIAHFSCFIQDNISGKINSEVFKLFKSDIKNEKVVLADGSIVPISINGDKAYAKYLSSGIAHNVDLENSVSVYPNPTSNVLNINFVKSDHYKIKLQDQLGNIITEEEFDATKITLDINKLPSGIYFLKIESSDGMAIKKILKD